MEVGEALHELGVALALEVGAVGHLLLHPLQLLLHLGIVGESLASLLAHDRVVGQPHHLRQIADGGAAGNGDHATRGLLLATQYLEHRTLARTIFADQGDAVVVVDDKAHVAEQWLRAKLHGKSFYRNHAILLIKLGAKLHIFGRFGGGFHDFSVTLPKLGCTQQ